MDSRYLANRFKPAKRLTGMHIAQGLIIVICILVGIILPRLSDVLKLALIFAIPTTIIAILIIRNPYVGVFLYFLYDFLRPYDFIPGLLPLRLAMQIEIITLLSWILLVATKNLKIKINIFSALYFCFLGVIATTTVTASNNRAAYDIFQAMAVIFIMFIIATNVVNSQLRLKRIIVLLLIIHFYFALRGLYNYVILHNITGGMHTSGAVGSSFIGDENDFAMTINFMIPFTFFFFNYAKRKLVKFACVVLLITFVFAVVVSMSRGGLVGLCVVMVFCVLKSRRKIFNLGYLLVICLALIAFAPPTYWDEVSTITDLNENTASSRLQYWEAAYRIYLDYPVMGVGAGNGSLYLPFYLVNWVNPETQWGRAFHGTQAQLIADLGSLGAIFYVMMIVYAFKKLLEFRKNKYMKDDEKFNQFVADSVLGGMLGYFSCSIFLSTLYYPQLWTLYTLTITLLFLKNSSKIKNSIDMDQGE